MVANLNHYNEAFHEVENIYDYQHQNAQNLKHVFEEKWAEIGIDSRSSKVNFDSMFVIEIERILHLERSLPLL
jgi:hypothetical protein